MPTPPPPSLDDLQGRLTSVPLHDERRLQGRIASARRLRDPEARRRALDEIATAVESGERRLASRRLAVPTIRYPPTLPVSRRRDDILTAIQDNQVVVVAGETGSGKTTQLPKMCLELGRGIRGLIGHTQPRRIAARAVAERIAEELETPLGAVVGYKVRFSASVSERTLVKVMTDGIVLAEIQRDHLLSEYDTLIIDEAHERSLNIDFLLGYLTSLLPRRPDLKIIITSATIDTRRFSEHFGDAPVVEVSGRTYPVEVRYRPIVVEGQRAGAEERDQTSAICEAVTELGAEGPGDTLVFLSGEREIRDTADALRQMHLPDTEILPLYARLSAAEQHRVFAHHRGRRIVLATNVAETSLTVPGIRYVVDPGQARISRYSTRRKVQRLPIEPVSRASADQRKGRCGRLSDGVCIRLYSEDDFLARPEYTEPEILRTNLASVILQMTALGLGDVGAFPFVDRPDPRSVADGVQLLSELGALDPAEQDPRRRLTRVGRSLAQLPVDPRLGRMVLEADRNGCVREVVVIVAALSIQDPRERPADRPQVAAELHARFDAKGSDFLAYLHLWHHLEEQQKELSSSAFRRMCRVELLHYLRVREWQDLVVQLRRVVADLGISMSSSPNDRDGISRSVLAGLLSHIGLRDAEKKDYLGARGTRFTVSPGSALFRRPPQWVMAAELVETSRLWARVVARIDPDWVESLAGHLVLRTYSEPHWNPTRAGVVAYEKVTLYGVPLVTSRRVDYGRIDPRLSRELFIREALVEGNWQTSHRFLHDNRALLEEVEELEHRARRRGIVVDDEALYDFYDARIGPDVVSGRHFDSWWKQVRRTQADLLSFEAEMLVHAGTGVSDADYPDHWGYGDLRLDLSYRFEPGADADGVTVHIPLPVLNQVPADALDWQVPGLREELVTALLRSLPKPVRRAFVPAPDSARAVLQRLGPATGDGPLLLSLERELHAMTGVAVPAGSWDRDRLPAHLRVTFLVEDEQGRTLAEGKDLEAIRRRLARTVRAAVSAAASEIERSGLRTWSIGTLPRTFERPGPGGTVVGYPSLVDEGDSVAVRVLPSAAEQSGAMWQGTRRLLLLSISSPVRSVLGRLTNATKLALSTSPYPTVRDLLDDCAAGVLNQLIADGGGPAWEPDAFLALQRRAQAGLVDGMTEVVPVVARVLVAWAALGRRLAAPFPAVAQPSVTDIREQLSGLVHPGFVSVTGRHRVPDLARYLQAIDRRLDALPSDPPLDQARMSRIGEMSVAYRNLLDVLPGSRRGEPAVRQVRWMIEELRVSVFAQSVGTAYPVSEQRIHRAIDALAP